MKIFNELKNLDSLTVNSDSSEVDDVYSLGVHLVSEHGCLNKSDFNDTYKVTILEYCSPRSLEVKEHTWIHKLNSLAPSGINRANPFSLPLFP